MTDPMLAKAAALEEELLSACDATKGTVRRGVVATQLMQKAALQLQQMRIQLESLQRDGVE